MIRPLATRWALLGAVFGVALCVRLAAGFWWQARLPDGSRFAFPDSESYWVLAQAIVTDQPYQFGSEHGRVFRMPGYPIVLAGLFCLVGEDPPVIWARVLSALLGTAAVGGVICLAWRLFGERAALLAGCIAALDPGAIAMSTFVLSEAPFCVLMLVQIILWTESDRAVGAARRIGAALAAGLAAGAATLVRPSWLLFTPLAVGAQWLGGRHRAQRGFEPIANHAPRGSPDPAGTADRRSPSTSWDRLLAGLAMLAALAAAMAPWWIRNYRVTGRFVPTTLQVGVSLYDGLNPRATGASDTSFVDEFQRVLFRQDAARRAPPTDVFEVRLDRLLRREAVCWARENPRRVVRLMGVKLLRMWNVWPNATELSSWPVRVVVMVGYAPLLICGLWGAWRSVGRGWPYGLCVLPAVYFTCVHVVFVSSIRYRQPAMLPLMALAAGALGSVLWRSGRGDG